MGLINRIQSQSLSVHPSICQPVCFSHWQADSQEDAADAAARRELQEAAALAGARASARGLLASGDAAAAERALASLADPLAAATDALKPQARCCLLRIVFYII